MSYSGDMEGCHACALFWFFMAWESDNSFNHAMQFLLRLWQYFLSDNLTERLRRSHFWPREWNFKKRGSEGVLFSQSAVPMQPRKIRGYGGALDSQSEQVWGGRMQASKNWRKAQCRPGGAAGPGVTPVSHRCHVSSIRFADCLYKSPATCTPQCPTEVALDMRGSSWVYSDHSGEPGFNIS